MEVCKSGVSVGRRVSFRNASCRIDSAKHGRGRRRVLDRLYDCPRTDIAEKVRFYFQ